MLYVSRVDSKISNQKQINPQIARNILQGVFECFNSCRDECLLSLLHRYVSVLFRSPIVMCWIAPHFKILSEKIDPENSNEIAALVLKQFTTWKHNVDDALKLTVKSLAMRHVMDSLSMVRNTLSTLSLYSETTHCNCIHDRYAERKL